MNIRDRFVTALVATAGLLIAGCEREDLTSPEAAPAAAPEPGLSSLIQDAAQGGGVPYFRWQPPMVPSASVGGPSDGAQKPVVEICRLVGGACGARLVTYTSTSGSPRVRYHSRHQVYAVEWNTRQFNLKPRKDFRITVKVAGVTLGLADAAVVSSRREVRALDPTQFVGVVNGQILEIRFRIERNAEGAVLAATSNSSTAQTLGTATSSTGTSALLTIPANTTINGGAGVVGLTVQATPPPAGAPTAGLAGKAYEFGPTGTTFSPPVTIAIQYPNAVAPAVAQTLRLYTLTAAGRWHLTENSGVNQTTRTVTGQSDHFSLYVAAEQVQTVDIVQVSATVAVGQTVQLDATIDQAGREVNWTTSDPAVATVDPDGLVTGIGGGEATITATSEGQSDQATVAVTSPGAGSNPSRAAAINQLGQVVGFITLAGTTATHAVLWQNGTRTDLGTLGGTSSQAYGINDHGQVVGISETADGEQHAFLWDGGTMTDLGTLGGAGFSQALGLNDNDVVQVVGSSETANSNPENMQLHAFLWLDGAMTDLDTFGSESSFASAINDIGQVVGGFVSSADLGTHAFLWENGTMTDIGVIGNQSRARAINGSSQIVGTSEINDGENHAVMWQNGTMTDLLGTRGAHAVAINDLGQVAGSYTTSSDETHAFLWENGTVTDLGTLGGTSSVAFGINDLGQVVGQSSTPGDAEQHAFLWEDGVMTDLGTLGGSQATP